jgi:integrase
MWEKIILPALGNRKVAAITHDDCDQLHSEIARDRPVRANRVIEVLRKAMNLAIRWGWRVDNPASGVHRSAEEPRERYLSQEEVSRLVLALAGHPERTSAAAIRLMLLTGCRRNEALSARWEEFDLTAGVWTKPSAHTKQRKCIARRYLIQPSTCCGTGRRSQPASSSFPERTGGH